MSKKFSIAAVISLTDKVSKPMKDLQKNTSKAMGNMGKNFTGTQRVVNKFKNKYRSTLEKAKAPLRNFANENKKVVKKLRVTYAKAERSVMKFQKKFKKAFGQALKKTVQAFALAVTAALAIAVREFIAFDDALTRASAKFDGGYQRGIGGFKELSESVRNIAANTEFTATDVANGLDSLALAGFGAKQSMELLPSITNLATVANTDFADATSIASDTLGAFGKRSDDAVVQGANLQKIMDVMTYTATSANTDLSTMFESIKMGAPAFTAAGQHMEDFAALTGVLANAGIKGTMAGTSLRSMMTRLAKPAGDAEKALNQLGVTVSEDGKFRNITAILADLENGMADLESKDKTAFLKTIFGERNVSAMSILLDEGATSIGNYSKEIKSATGSTQEMADVIRGSTSNQLKILKSKFSELSFQIVEAFEIDGRGALEVLMQKVEEFDVSNIVAGIKSFFKALKIGFTILRWGGPIVLGLVVGIKLYTTVMGLAAIATGAFGAALAVTPIGWIAIAIGVVIAAIGLLIFNWKSVVNAFKSAWNAIKTAIKAVIDSVKAYIYTLVDCWIMPLVGVIKGIMQAASAAGRALGFDTTGIDAAIQKVSDLQDSVREKSFIGGSSFFDPEPKDLGEVHVSQRGAYAARNGYNDNIEITIKDESGKAEITRAPKVSGYAAVSLAQSGGM